MMKKIMLLALVCSAFALAGAQKEAFLYSKKRCRAMDSVCLSEAQFLTDQKGRCACLTVDDYKPASFCMRAHFGCDVEKGYTYSRLENEEEEFVGCGCFKTAK